MKNIFNTIIIAEAGVNHNGSLYLAKKLALGAKKAGADYIKFQIYKTEKLVKKNAPLSNYQKKKTISNQFELLKKYELKYEDFIKIKKYCSTIKIKFLATPFDLDSLNFLIKKIYPDYIKISSGDLDNFQLLNGLRLFKKKIIISTGMSNVRKISKTIKFLLQFVKKSQLILLHCNTEYPTPIEDINLKAMLFLKKKFNINVGYSDHSEGIVAPVLASYIGAKILEKHITLDKKMPGPDHASSADINDFKLICSFIKDFNKFLGSSNKKLSKSEKKNLTTSTRSIYAKKKITAGEILSEKNLICLRPAKGIVANKYFDILGKKSSKNFLPGDLIFFKK